MYGSRSFVKCSCDIKINIEIVQNCCRNLMVKELISVNNKYYQRLNFMMSVCASHNAPFILSK